MYHKQYSKSVIRIRTGQQQVERVENTSKVTFRTISVDGMRKAARIVIKEIAIHFKNCQRLCFRGEISEWFIAWNIFNTIKIQLD